jgi:hypothetical protein
MSKRAQFMVVAGYNHVLRALWAMVFAINQSLLITCVVAAVAGDAGEDVFQHNFMAYWMWLFYASICFIFMNATLAGILGITAFQLASTFLLILQLTSGTVPPPPLLTRAQSSFRASSRQAGPC